MKNNSIEIVAKRLKQARTFKMLSMEQLCVKMNNIVTKQSIAKYEAAKMMPNSGILIALANALDVDIDYFFRPFSFEVENFQVSFRKKADMGVKETKALMIQIQDDIERYLEVEDVLGVDSEAPVIPEGGIISSKEQMIECVDRLRAEWMIGYDTIANVQELLESKGVKIINTEAPASFDGVSGVVNGKHYIVVLNKKMDFVERRRFTALHELGHLLFNTRFDTSLSQKQIECLCDTFASEMLLPSGVLRNYYQIGAPISTSSLKYLQSVYGISIDAIMNKVHLLGIISDGRYRSYCIRKNNEESIKAMVKKSRFQESETKRFESMVFTAASKDLISLSKAASLLHFPVSTIRRKISVF